MYRLLISAISLVAFTACAADPSHANGTSGSKGSAKQARMIVKPVYEPDGCDPSALNATCTLQQAGSDDLYWQMEVIYPESAPGTDYKATSFFRAVLQKIKADERAITVNFEIPGATPLDANMNVPLVAFSQTNNGPFSNALSIHPGWVTPWTLGRKLTSTPVTIEGRITDTHADDVIQAVNAVVKAITAAGVGSEVARVAYNSAPVQGLIVDMQNLDAEIQKSRSGETPLSNPQMTVYPAYLKSIDVSQVGLFENGDGLLFQIVVKWQHSIFAQPISSGWLSSKVLQTPDDDPASPGNGNSLRTFQSVISSDPTVASWKSGTPVPLNVCNRIMKVGQNGGLAPVDQVILTLAWLQNQSWDTDISLHDESDSCAKSLAALANAPDFPKGARSVTSLLASSVKPRPVMELTNRSGNSSAKAFLAFQKALSGASSDDNRLSPDVTVTVSQSISELDDFLSLVDTGGRSSAVLDAGEFQALFAKKPPENPLVLDLTKRNCFSYDANAASNKLQYRCMSLKRSNGTSTPLDVVILTDKPVFTEGDAAKIQSIQFSLPQATAPLATR